MRGTKGLIISNFPIMLFTSVMGIGGLSLAFKKASLVYGHELASPMQNLFAPFFNISSIVFGILAAVLFIILFIFYGLKMIYFKNDFLSEITHQVRINFFSTVPISMLIIIVFLNEFKDVDSVFMTMKIIFYIATFLQLILSLYVIIFWIKNSMKNHLLSPAWFIPIVGNLIVPLAGHVVDSPKDILLFFFSVGCFFWIVLMPIIMQRLIFEQSLEEKFLPTFFIFIAPPSIFIMDFHLIFKEHNEFSVMVYFLALFFVFLVTSFSKIFFKLKFTLSWWAFTFPLCAFSIASSDMYLSYSHKGICGYEIFLSIGLFASFLSVVYVGCRTIKAIINGDIFVKE